MLPDLVPRCSDSNKIRLQTSATSTLQQKPRTTPATAPPHPLFSFSFSPRTTTPRNDTKFRKLAVTKDSRERERERASLLLDSIFCRSFSSTLHLRSSRDNNLIQRSRCFFFLMTKEKTKTCKRSNRKRKTKTNNNCLTRKLANDHEHKKRQQQWERRLHFVANSPLCVTGRWPGP